MRLHLIPDHFYRFYTLGDVIKGVIMLVVMHVLLTPFIIWAVQFFIYGHSIFLIVLLSGISLINIGYFIKAVICWRIYVRQMKYLKDNNLLPNPNVDIIWQVKRPW